MAVLLDFLLQVTAFVALICFDFLRAEDNRIDCFPCIKVFGSNADSEKGKSGRISSSCQIFFLLNEALILNDFVGNQQRKPGLLVRYMKVMDSFKCFSKVSSFVLSEHQLMISECL